MGRRPDRRRTRPIESGFMWKQPQLASKRSDDPATAFVQGSRWMSQLPSGHVALAAFTTAPGSNSAPVSRTWAAVRA